MHTPKWYSWAAVSLTAFLLVRTHLSAEPLTTTEFEISHALKVTAVPPGSQVARIWFWLPDDHEGQKVLDLVVKGAPGDFRVMREPVYGNKFLYVEVQKPHEEIPISTSFLMQRQALGGALDPSKAGKLTEAHRALLAEDLRRDCPYMEVTKDITKLADEICGAEANVVLQARCIYDHLVSTSDHYSLPGAPKSSGQGSAKYCLESKGGGCTDQHALFIALARARGIPTRLQFGCRLASKNEGKEFDPGYRCWVEYFVPNYGWVSADVSAGDTTPSEQDWFVSGLDCNRVHFSAGRDFDLVPKQSGPRLNLFIGAYVEVDGKPHPAFTRTMMFRKITP